MAVIIPGFKIIIKAEGMEGNQSRIHPTEIKIEDNKNIRTKANKPEKSVTFTPRDPENQRPLLFSSLSMYGKEIREMVIRSGTKIPPPNEE